MSTFIFKCNNCDKSSNELQKDEYRRLSPNQIWICSDCKEEIEGEISKEEEFAGGYILTIKKSDF